MALYHPEGFFFLKSPSFITVWSKYFNSKCTAKSGFTLLCYISKTTWFNATTLASFSSFVWSRTKLRKLLSWTPLNRNSKLLERRIFQLIVSINGWYKSTLPSIIASETYLSRLNPLRKRAQFFRSQVPWKVKFWLWLGKKQNSHLLAKFHCWKKLFHTYKSNPTAYKIIYRAIRKIHR